MITKTELHKRIPFNMDSPFIQLYFGRQKNRLVTYSEFSQFLHDFHEEYAIEGFRKADKDGTGFISVLDFQDIMLNIKSHLLTKEVQSHLIEVTVFGETYVRLFNVCRIFVLGYLTIDCVSDGDRISKWSPCKFPVLHRLQLAA